MDVDEPDLLIQFINRPDTDPGYITDDETFIAKEYVQQEQYLVNVTWNGCGIMIL